MSVVSAPAVRNDQSGIRSLIRYVWIPFLYYGSDICLFIICGHDDV